ncbi:hypothetical protein LINPERHAP1_LOCUS11497, partial [Linum perenne]
IDSGVVLVDHAINLQGVNSSLSVADFCSNGTWDISLLRSVLPEEFVLQVVGMTPPRAGWGSDAESGGLKGMARFQEDQKHVFRACPFAQQVWQWVLPQAVHGELSDMGFRDWWRLCISNRQFTSIFGFTMWLLWRSRNKLIFEEATTTVEEIVNQ